MDSTEFSKITKPLLKWNKNTGRDVLKPQLKSCEDCGDMVEDRKVYCYSYRLGSPAAYFKHECTVCKQVLYCGRDKAEHRVKMLKYNKKSGRNYK